MAVIFKTGNANGKCPAVEVTAANPLDSVLGFCNDWWADARENVKNIFTDLATLVASDPECREILEMEIATIPDNTEGRERRHLINRIMLAASISRPDSQAIVRLADSMSRYCGDDFLKDETGNTSWNIVSNSITALALLTMPNWSRGLRAALADNFLKTLGAGYLNQSLARLTESPGLHPELAEIVQVCVRHAPVLSIPTTQLLGDLLPQLIPPRDFLAKEASRIFRETSEFFKSVPERLLEIQTLLLEVKAEQVRKVHCRPLLPDSNQAGGDWYDFVARYSSASSQEITYQQIHRVVSLYVDEAEADRLSKQGPCSELIDLLTSLSALFIGADKLKAIEKRCIKQLQELHKTNSGQEYIDQQMFSTDPVISMLANQVIDAEIQAIDSEDNAFNGEIVRRPAKNTPEGAFVLVRELVMLFEGGHRLYTLLEEVTNSISNPAFAEILPAENFLPELIKMAQGHAKLSKDTEGNNAGRHAEWISNMMTAIICHSAETELLIETNKYASPKNRNGADLTQPIKVFQQGVKYSENGIRFALKHLTTLHQNSLKYAVDSFAHAVGNPETEKFNLEKKILSGNANGERDLSRMAWLLAHTSKSDSAVEIVTALLWLSRYSSGLAEWLGSPDQITQSIRHYVTNEREQRSLNSPDTGEEAIAAIKQMDKVFSELGYSTLKISSELQRQLSDIYTEKWRDEFRRICLEQEKEEKQAGIARKVSAISLDRPGVLSENLLPSVDTGAGFVLECRRLKNASQSEYMTEKHFTGIAQAVEGKKGERLISTVPAPPLIDEVLSAVTGHMDQEADMAVVGVLAKIAKFGKATKMHFHSTIGITEEGIEVPDQAKYIESENINHPDGMSALVRRLRIDMIADKVKASEHRIELMVSALNEASDEKFKNNTLLPHDIVPYDTLLIFLVAGSKEAAKAGHPVRVYDRIFELLSERKNYRSAMRAMFKSSPAALNAELKALKAELSAEDLIKSFLRSPLFAKDLPGNPLAAFVIKCIASNPYYHYILLAQISNSKDLSPQSKKYIQTQLNKNKRSIVVLTRQAVEGLQKSMTAFFPDKAEFSLLSKKWNFTVNYQKYYSTVRLLIDDKESHPGRGQILIRQLEKYSAGLLENKTYVRHEIISNIRAVSRQYLETDVKSVKKYADAVEISMPEAAMLIALSILECAEKNKDQQLANEVGNEIMKWCELVPGSVRIDNILSSQSIILSLSPAETIVHILLNPQVSPRLHSRALKFAPSVFCRKDVLEKLLSTNLSEEQLRINLCGILAAYSNTGADSELMAVTRELSVLAGGDQRIRQLLAELLSPGSEGGIEINNAFTEFMTNNTGLNNIYDYQNRIAGSLSNTKKTEKAESDPGDYTMYAVKNARLLAVHNFINTVLLLSGDDSDTAVNRPLLNLLSQLPASKTMVRALIFQLCQSGDRAGQAARLLNDMCAYDVPEWLEEGHRVTYTGLMRKYMMEGK